MENLITVKQYVKNYHAGACPNLSTEIVRRCLEKHWNNWCTTELTFQIDCLANTQFAMDGDNWPALYEQSEFYETENLKRTATNIVWSMERLWEELDRTPARYKTPWNGYANYLAKERPEAYQENINMIIQYIRLKLAANQHW